MVGESCSNNAIIVYTQHIWNTALHHIKFLCSSKIMLCNRFFIILELQIVTYCLGTCILPRMSSKKHVWCTCGTGHGALGPFFTWHMGFRMLTVEVAPIISLDFFTLTSVVTCLPRSQVPRASTCSIPFGASIGSNQVSKYTWINLYLHLISSLLSCFIPSF